MKSFEKTMINLMNNLRESIKKSNEQIQKLNKLHEKILKEIKTSNS